MLRSITIAALILCSSSALAQQTTNCSPDGTGGVHCVTNGNASQSGANWGLLQQPPATNPMDAFNRGYEDAQRRRVDRQEQEMIAAQQQALAAQQQAQSQTANYEAEQRELGVRAGQMVQAGDCPGALKLALTAGNIVLANSVKQYCAR